MSANVKCLLVGLFLPIFFTALQIFFAAVLCVFREVLGVHCTGTRTTEERDD